MEGFVRYYERCHALEVSGGPTRETIFALSSGNPPAAIAIVRVSGPQAAQAVRTMCASLPPPREAALRPVRDGAGALIDRALVLWFPGPASATGEDLAELHLHGGRAVVAATLAALDEVPGCRRAVAGEFTRRAFEHGRIDLLQAEGLADLLAAETEGARVRALRLAEGGLSRLIAGWREQLVMLSARVEAVLEFGGDDPDIVDDPALPGEIAALADAMARSLATPPAERLRDGVRVVIAGPPNAGKSTLINALAGREVAIATPIPGTTRDLVEASVIIDGVAMILIDSAGLRETSDAIELLGVAVARSAMRAADIILWLGDPADRPDHGALVICVHSRIDQPGRLPLPALADIGICAVQGQGIAALQQTLVGKAKSLLPLPDANLARHQRTFVEQALGSLRIAVEDSNDLIRAHQLAAAAGALDEMTGRRSVEPMLDALFARFCVGK